MNYSEIQIYKNYNYDITLYLNHYFDTRHINKSCLIN